MQFLYLILASVLGGILAGMGMGGGTFTLPILVLVMGVSQLTAQYANLIAFLPSGAIALAMHAKNGLVKWDNVAYLFVPALITCIASSFFATEISGDILKKSFGVFLVVLGVFSLANFVIRFKQTK